MRIAEGKKSVTVSDSFKRGSLQAMHAHLLLQTIHFPDDVCSPLIHLPTRWMGLFAVLFVHRVATVGPHVLEAAITDPQCLCWREVRLFSTKEGCLDIQCLQCRGFLYAVGQCSSWSR